jgi:hypothetical protein
MMSLLQRKKMLEEQRPAIDHCSIRPMPPVRVVDRRRAQRPVVAMEETDAIRLAPQQPEAAEQQSAPASAGAHITLV